MSGRPATSCRTFARSLFMRVPRPAAMMTTMGCDIFSGTVYIPGVRMPSWLVAIALVGATGGTARAHQASASYATLTLGEDPATARYEIRIASRDLYEALALESDRDATDAEIAAGRDRLLAYV